MLRLGIVPTVAEVWRLVAWLRVTIVYIGLWLGLRHVVLGTSRARCRLGGAGHRVWPVITLFGMLLLDLIAGAVAPVTAGTLDEQLRNVQGRPSS